MPVVSPSGYKSPLGLSNGHLQTVVAHLRNVPDVAYRRERISTPDDDFLDLDWVQNGADRVAILSHGLEGNTQRPYVRGMARALHLAGWDALAWNYRGCSGETNRRLRWYHSGETGDLHTVILHVAAQNRYREMALIGFSLGGNITLKYLGEHSSDIPAVITRGIAFSVPCDLKSSAYKMAGLADRPYMTRFLISLRQKVRSKMKMFPGQINDEGLDRIRTFVEFDNQYTAPIHGFRDAFDYFARCSSRQFLTNIRVPALLVNAKNDPFLDEASFPYEEARESEYLHLDTPESGGHMGFVTFGHGGQYWSETRAVSFLA